MKILKIYFAIFIALLLKACINNSLDNLAQIDCSVSMLDFTVATTDADCGQSNGVIKANATGGEPPYLYNIEDGPSIPFGAWDDLQAGSYFITVKDATMSCFVTKEVILVSKSGFQAIATATSSGCKTSNASITLEPIGGVAPYIYTLGTTSQLSPVFGNLSTGEYQIKITDDVGCDFSLVKNVFSGTSYATMVKPIIVNNCTVTGCHDGSRFPDLRVLANVQANKARIKEFTQSGFMPREGSLTQAEKDAIACWVDDGAKDN